MCLNFNLSLLSILNYNAPSHHSGSRSTGFLASSSGSTLFSKLDIHVSVFSMIRAMVTVKHNIRSIKI